MEENGPIDMDCDITKFCVSFVTMCCWNWYGEICFGMEFTICIRYISIIMYMYM